MGNGRHKDKVILVTGATGKQGGAVARELLKRGFRVRGLSRDPDKDAARALVDLGADIVQGDLSDRGSLDHALRRTYGVYSVQNFAETGVEEEVRQGTMLADVAKAADTAHFVYSSVASAHRGTGIPHFDSKWRVEEHVRALRLPHTILRPVFFMENWEAMRDQIIGGAVAQPLKPATRLQQVAVDDIGVFAGLAFKQPEKWLGRAIDIAGDELTMREAADTFSRVTGREVTYTQVPWERFRAQAGEEYTIMYRWFEEVGYDADIAGVRAQHPAVLTLEQYLRTAGWVKA